MNDATHDPELRSWVKTANAPQADFPIQNLPFGVFRRAAGEGGRAGVAIGDRVLDLHRASELGLLGSDQALLSACRAPRLNELMALGPSAWSALRRRLSQLLRGDAPGEPRTAEALVAMADVELLLPAQIGDYTDFYCSLHHAINVGSIFRPDNPLMPNYKHLPVGYHGRASSLVVSGTPVRRPSGQTRSGDAPPSFGPSRSLDYELELGFFVGPGNRLGTTIPLARAAEHIFGYCLVNDWSARDVQRWEYQPLGPFLGKSFATTVSPWVVTGAALEPFRVPAWERAAGDPPPLPYLDHDADRQRGGVDLNLEVYLSTAAMRAAGQAAVRLSRSNARQLYWTPAQMLAHHASNGCNLRPGDLIASGTVSGPEKGSRGCLLELTGRGSEPLELPGGERRTFLEDGDEVILRGYCAGPGCARIGFGECRGVVLPARAD
ncbi:MAG: fumarylacetoacetase [Acidobacteria bacterium]|nr:MAG: fumarylacetoacetase [Acidobacteriota bacterium]